MSQPTMVLVRFLFLISVTYWTWHLLGFEMVVVFLAVQIIMILSGIADRMDMNRKQGDR